VSDPTKKPPRPDATIVDSLDDALAPTTVNPVTSMTPIGKRPVHSTLTSESSLRKASGMRAPHDLDDPPTLPSGPPLDVDLAPLTEHIGQPVVADTMVGVLAESAGTLASEQTFTGDESLPEPLPEPPPSADNTYDLPQVGPATTLGGLDENQFRRALWGLGAGAVLLLILVLIWGLMHFDDGSVEGRRATHTVRGTTGTVRIVTEPEASVSVDGRQLGTAPLQVELPAGRNTVVLENKKLALKRTVTVDVTADGQSQARFAFSRGWLQIDAPADARVSIDGRSASSSRMQVWEGTHRVEVTYADKKKTREVQSVEVGAGATIRAKFAPPSN
jgi:hypothetical protein